MLTVTNKGSQIKELISPKIYFLFSDNTVSDTIMHEQNSEISIDSSTLTYKNIFPNIDVRISLDGSIRKLDYILNDEKFVKTIPKKSSFVVFEETIELPDFWYAKLDSSTGDISIYNSNSDIEYIYMHPFANSVDDNIDMNYRFYQNSIINSTINYQLSLVR